MEATASGKQKKKIEFPHVFILMMAITLVFALLSYVIPSSEYQMKDITYTISGVEKTRSVVDPNTWALTADQNVSLMQYMTSFMRGMEATADIIFYIFIVVGSFYILNETAAVTAGIGKLIKRMGNKTLIIVPVLGAIFGIFGSTAGLFEETLAFIPILLPIFLGMGYDSLLAVAVVIGGAIAGWAGTVTNPFTLGVAQGIAGLPMFSGMTYHIIGTVLFIALTCSWFTWYAVRIRKDPTKSVMYEADKARDNTEKVDLDALPVFDTRRKLCLLVFIVAMVLMIWGVLKKGWYFEEISAVFLGMAIILTFVSGHGLNWFANNLCKGMESMIVGALVVGFARSILVVLTDADIIHTILHAMSSFLSSLPGYFNVVGQYIFQCLLNYIVPSGSGQAAVTMPIMAPLADMTGVTRQTACLCEVFGDAISNVFTPTSGAFMAGLALADIPWNKWVKFYWPIICMQYGLGLILVIVAQAIHLGPF